MQTRTKNSWFETTYRKLFFDFHNHESTKFLANNFRAKLWAEKLAQIGIEAASVFVKCGLGFSYYRKGKYRIVHPELPEGLDMLEEQIKEFHARDIKAIGYYYTFSSNVIADERPEWIFLNGDGTPEGSRELSGYAICLIGPFLDEYLIPQIEEIVSLYELDGIFFDGTFTKGICHCDSCRKRFKKDTGLDISNEETRKKRVEWRLEQYSKMRVKICESIHKIKPEMIVSFNAAYTPRQPERVPDEVDALIIDTYPYDQTFQGSYHSAFFSLSNRPFEIMNTAFLDWWGDWGCKPSVAMQQEVAPVLAYGGIPWPGYQVTNEHSVQDAVIKELGKTLEFIKCREDLVKASEQIPFAAVLINTKQDVLSNHFKEKHLDSMLDETRFHAAHRVLMEGMIPHHIITEDILSSRLKEFKAIIVSNQKRVPAKLVNDLEKWVKDGGLLIVSSFSQTEGEKLPDPLFELLGIKYERAYPESHAYVEITDSNLKNKTLDMPHIAETDFHIVSKTCANVKTLANLREVYLRGDDKYLRRLSPPGPEILGPAITARRLGKGHAVYFAGDLFESYHNKNQWNIRNVILNLIDNFIKKPVEVESQVWLETVMTRQTANGKDRKIIHLINHHGSFFANERIKFLETSMPVKDVNLKIKQENAPVKATLEPVGTNLNWRHENGILSLDGISVEIHSAIVIEQ